MGLVAERAGVDRARQQVGVAGVLLSRPAGEPDHERVLACRQGIERGFGVAEIGEGEAPLGAPLHLADRLRAAQHEDAKRSQLGRLETELLVEHVAVLGRAVRLAVDDAGVAELAQVRE